MQKIIDSDGAFTVLNNVNADRIDCDGMINVPHGTVSADVIRVDGCIFACWRRRHCTAQGLSRSDCRS